MASCPYCGESNPLDTHACGACQRSLVDSDAVTRRQQRVQLLERLRRAMASSIMSSPPGFQDVEQLIAAEDRLGHLFPSEVKEIVRPFEMNPIDYSTARSSFIRAVKNMEDSERDAISVASGLPNGRNPAPDAANGRQRHQHSSSFNKDLDELRELLSLRRQLKTDSGGPEVAAENAVFSEEQSKASGPAHQGRPDASPPVNPLGTFTIPSQFGKYEVLKRLRQGGMGTLLLARDPQLDRQVAIKVIRPDIDSPALRERFKQEARDLSRLRHPNIVTIHDYGEVNSLPYLAMEYIDGESFADLIERRPPLSAVQRLQFVIELCDGVAYVHKAQIVHRDLKPDNVMIDRETGLVKILDFGIARRLETGVSKFTRDIGTPCYMAPEQILSGRVDARTDIWAIGTILYELLSYQRAFDGETYAAVAKRIVENEPPRLTDLNPALDPATVQVVERALSKDPRQRYQTAADLRHAVAGLADITRVGLGDQTVPPPVSVGKLNTTHGDVRRTRIRAIVLITFLVLALGWLVYSYAG